jgi:hypothetical protein
MICREDVHLALISGYNNVTSQHTYIGGYQTCAVLISMNCAQFEGFTNEDPKKVPPYVGSYLSIEACDRHNRSCRVWNQ